jgi:hypothetical protein
MRRKFIKYNDKCAVCGKTFEVIRFGTKCCSRTCSAILPKARKVERKCEWCGETFWIKPSVVSKGKGKYCQRSCFDAGRKREFLLNKTSEQDRFWVHVQKQEGDGCWIWMDPNQHGYGFFRGDERTGNAHTFSWEWENGPIPKGMYVCHNCPGGDNKACVRPSHMFLGTNLDNMRDAKNKGQILKGETHHKAKLTEDQVREIRRLCDEGQTTYTALANKYGVNPSAISNIYKRKSWAWLKEASIHEGQLNT